MNIFFNDEDDRSPGIPVAMEKSAKRCLELEGIDENICELSVTFMDASGIRQLNNRYRGIDKVTDVLSFPQYASPEEMTGEVIELGDVVICAEKAKEQARDFGHSFEREMMYLFTHGMLHLLGYDHMEESDRKKMRAREEEVMSYLDLSR